MVSSRDSVPTNERIGEVGQPADRLLGGRVDATPDASPAVSPACRSQGPSLGTSLPPGGSQIVVEDLGVEGLRIETRW